MLTAPRSPTTTGKVERFQRTIEKDFLAGKTFESIEEAQERSFDDHVGRWLAGETVDVVVTPDGRSSPREWSRRHPEATGDIIPDLTQ